MIVHEVQSHVSSEDRVRSGEAVTESTVNQMIVVAEVHREDVRTPECGVIEEDDLQSVTDGLQPNVVRCMRVRNNVLENDREVNDDVASGPAGDTVLPWSWEGLKLAQREDADVGCIIQLLQTKQEKPEWELVSLKSDDVKKLWACGLGYRRGMGY